MNTNNCYIKLLRFKNIALQLQCLFLKTTTWYQLSFFVELITSMEYVNLMSRSLRTRTFCSEHSNFRVALLFHRRTPDNEAVLKQPGRIA